MLMILLLLTYAGNKVRILHEREDTNVQRREFKIDEQESFVNGEDDINFAIAITGGPSKYLDQKEVKEYLNIIFSQRGMRTEDEYAIKNIRNTVLESRDCSIEQLDLLRTNSPGKDFPMELLQQVGYQMIHQSFY